MNMALKLAMPDYAFPKLEWERALRLVRDLGMQAVDIGLFTGRSHLRPETILCRPSEEADNILSTVGSYGLEIADIFGQSGTSFVQKAVNHPNLTEREMASDFFWRFLELAGRCSAKHMTILPGVHFEQEAYQDSLNRCAEELVWRVEAASQQGIALGVEPHVGSIVSRPMQVRRLLELVPTLSLTLDYGHFTCRGIEDDEIEPLLAHCSHFHARAACSGKLQAPLNENTIDFVRILHAMERSSYKGYVAVEYVWSEWMNCNQVDVLSETILLRDLLREAIGGQTGVPLENPASTP
jgi:sugar phosphate isomerase/epimerase